MNLRDVMYERQKTLINWLIYNDGIVMKKT